MCFVAESLFIRSMLKFFLNLSVNVVEREVGYEF